MCGIKWSDKKTKRRSAGGLTRRQEERELVNIVFDKKEKLNRTCTET